MQINFCPSTSYNVAKAAQSLLSLDEATERDNVIQEVLKQLSANPQLRQIPTRHSTYEVQSKLDAFSQIIKQAQKLIDDLLAAIWRDSTDPEAELNGRNNTGVRYAG